MNPITIDSESELDLDDYDCDFGYQSTVKGIQEALEKWETDRESAYSIIKSVRKTSWEWDVLDIAEELSQQEKGTKERELAIYLISTSRHRYYDTSLQLAELLANESPTKACEVIHKALKKLDEEERLDRINYLCEHELPLFVEQAHKELRQMAIRGNTDAMHRLGYSYYYGESGYEKDWKLAYKWWKKSADLGNSHSMLELSIMLEHGEGIRCNRKKAFEYVKAAADAGLLRALTNLGYCYYWGIGTKKDVNAAVDCFKRVLEQKDCEVAAHNLAERYYAGEGVEQNYERAIELHRMAAKKEYPDSITRLGYMYIHGEGFPKNVKLGISYLRRAIKLGGARALCELGICYERGTGVPQNWEKAMELYEQSAANGYRFSRPEISRLMRKMQKKKN